MNVGYNSIKGVLEGTKQFVVPIFQRPYSWKKKQWDALWSDLTRLYEEDEYIHFIGAIVTAPIDVLPDAVTKHLLIDGQQRLTTITLLLAAIREVAGANDPQLVQQISEDFLVNRFHSDEDHLKLLPTLSDRAVFADILASKPLVLSRPVATAYRFFRTSIAGKVNSKTDPWDLRMLFNKVIGSLSVVMIQLSREDNPHLIFESLNAKGAPLTAADLIRNYVFMRISGTKEQLKVYHEVWLPMESRLGDPQRLTAFMRVVVMQSGVMVRRDDIYSQLQRFMARKEAKTPRTELEAISELSGLYLRLVDPSQESDTRLSEGFRTILQLDIATSHPLLLRLYSLHVEGKVSRESLLECIASIESFSIRRTFGFYSTRQLGALFVQIVRDLKESDVVTSVNSSLDKAGWPTDAAFETAFLTNSIYFFDQTKTAYVLKRLERSYGHKEQASLDKVTIEHVFPQNPRLEWQEHLGLQELIEMRKQMHRLGNLTLSAYNSEMSNKWFEQKKAWYAESKLELNKYFIGLDTWNAQSITDRGQALFDRAKNLWKKPVTVRD
jgi:uncharacterized protein with ParB-like and HNH nuclease domain